MLARNYKQIGIALVCGLILGIVGHFLLSGFNVKGMVKRLQTQGAEIKSLTDEVQTLEKDLQNKHAALKKVEKENQSNKKKAADLTSERNDLKKEVASLKQKEKRLEKQLKKTQNELSIFKKKDANLRAGIAFAVPGKSDWVNTEIEVKAGDLLSFEAQGYVFVTNGESVTPDGDSRDRWQSYNVIPGVNHGAVIGVVGDMGIPFGIGSNREYRVQVDGILFLRVNDKDEYNNSGKFRVTVSKLE